MNNKFHLGTVFITRGIEAKIKENAFTSEDVLFLLNRHKDGDWGDMSKTDKRLNDIALISGDRIMSSYRIDGIKIWIITESTREMTTILLPDEY